MATTVNCCATQLIDSDGSFKVTELDNFIKSSNMACNLSYAVVAIMGSQSSGKSTLMNHLFDTSFREMDANMGRSQTTKGIWIAKCTGIEPYTIAMDLEGTDGRERGEDDTNFEKQSALFALAVSDVVLINMWCNNVGNVQAGGKPLLKTVFQAMMRLFRVRKTTLLFVLRDKSKTPLNILEHNLKEEIQTIWDGIKKPQACVDTPLSEFFNVEVTALSNYEHQEETFKKEVDQLRLRINNSIATNGLAGVPASAFSNSAQGMWKVIRENRDLDVPPQKVLVANLFCENIVSEMLNLLPSDKVWERLMIDVEERLVIDCREKLELIIDTYLSKYDTETISYDENVRNAKRKQLESKALEIVYPAFRTTLRHLRSKALKDFKTKLGSSLNNGELVTSVGTLTESIMLEFDKRVEDLSVIRANWDTSEERNELLFEIRSHASTLNNDELKKITTDTKKQLKKALAKPKFLFTTGQNDTWLSIRNDLRKKIKDALYNFSTRIAGLVLEMKDVEEIKQSLRDYATKFVDQRARNEAKDVVKKMKNRFNRVFNYVDDSNFKRDWTQELDEDIDAIIIKAHSASLKILSDMAAIRLDEKQDTIESVDKKKKDTIESVLFLSLINKSSAEITSVDLLDSSTWDDVSPTDIIISPLECKSYWEQFQLITKNTIEQAIKYQVARKNTAWRKIKAALSKLSTTMILPWLPSFVLIVGVFFRD